MVLRHSGGFVPPTTAHEFKYSNSSGVDNNNSILAPSLTQMKCLTSRYLPDCQAPPPISSVPMFIECPRFFGPKANALVAPAPCEASAKTQALSDQCIYTLVENPFWHPLLSVALSTLPLATTLTRLSCARAHGLPLHAILNNDDRKTHESSQARIRNMQLRRMESLAVEITEQLTGARGGFIGIGFTSKDKGHGIRCESLE